MIQLSKYQIIIAQQRRINQNTSNKNVSKSSKKKQMKLTDSLKEDC